MSTDKLILKKLKEGLSQSRIAAQVGVPRSVVQRVSDKEMGVDPASLKSLTNEQIIEIQKLAGSMSNAALGKQFDISAKTVARALLVKISEHANNVTVISPVEGLGADGEFDTTTDIHPGGVAKLLVATGVIQEGTEVYIGPFMEDRNQYMIGHKEGEKVYLYLVKHGMLEAVETGLSKEVLSDISEVIGRVLDTGVSRADGVEVLVNVPGENPFPLKGKLNSKGQVGYHDAITNLTVRVALSRVDFTYRTYEVLEEDKPAEGESTGKQLKGTDLDSFLGKHQIIILENQVTISRNGKPLTIGSEHQCYQAIVEAIKSGDIELAYELMEPRKAIEKFSQGRLLLAGKKVTWDGHDISGYSMAKRFTEVALKGDAVNMERFSKFLDKVFLNPSAQLVQSGRIFEFMKFADIEVDDDGDIIVYKVVSSNYMDKHSGTISNKPGTVIRMARSFVNDDSTDLCSYGLHVCAPAYIRKLFGSSGDRVLRCKLNPKDIVSITNDYNNSKIRCCEYLVLEDYTDKYNRKYKTIDMEGFYK